MVGWRYCVDFILYIHTSGHSSKMRADYFIQKSQKTQIACEINAAIRRGEYHTVLKLLELGQESFNLADADKRTPLMECAYIADEGVAVGLSRILLEKGASLKSRDILGMTALHHACLNERVDLTSTLLASSECNPYTKCIPHGNTALHYAVITANLSLITILVGFMRRFDFNMNIKNKQGLTPKEVALKMKNYHISDIMKTEYCKERELSTASLPIVARSRVKNVLARPPPSKTIQQSVSTIWPLSFPLQPSKTWRDDLSTIWDKYQQQQSHTFRKPAVTINLSSPIPSMSISVKQRGKPSLVQNGANPVGLDKEQNNEENLVQQTSKSLVSGRRYSVACPQRLKGQSLYQPSPSPSSLQIFKSRRQSLAV